MPCAPSSTPAWAETHLVSPGAGEEICLVTPAKAGVSGHRLMRLRHEISAFAGMAERGGMMGRRAEWQRKKQKGEETRPSRQRLEKNDRTAR